MESTAGARVQDLRYQADERPPQALALGLGFQYAMLAVAGIVLTPAIVVRAANGSDAFLSWATFAALADGGPGLLATLVAVSALFQFRAVQGAVTADGVGNLLSGLAATVPNTTYSSSVSITAITGVAARTVGVYIGIAFIVLAFLPKFMALILAIPGPVVGAYTIVLMATLFVLGMRVVSADHQG